MGTLDAHIRLSIGFSLLGMGVISSSKTMVTLGAMKIATGITRFCPIMHLLKITTLENDNSLEKFVKKIPEYADQAVDQLADNLGME